MGCFLWVHFLICISSSSLGAVVILWIVDHQVMKLCPVNRNTSHPFNSLSYCAPSSVEACLVQKRPKILHFISCIQNTHNRHSIARLWGQAMECLFFYSKSDLYPSLMIPDSKAHGTNMGPIWGRQDPGGPHVGPMNFAIWDCHVVCNIVLWLMVL